jgi:hypothetical protein
VVVVVVVGGGCVTVVSRVVVVVLVDSGVEEHDTSNIMTAVNIIAARVINIFIFNILVLPMDSLERPRPDASARKFFKPVDSSSLPDNEYALRGNWSQAPH